MKALSKFIAGIIGLGAAAALCFLLKKGEIKFSDELTLILLMAAACGLLWAFWDALNSKSSL